MSSSTSGRRRATDRHYSAEDQALDQISKEAEERIQARRQARAEAREIRLKEIERQQNEEEEKQKAPQQGSIDPLKSYSSSRRGSNDSTDTDLSSKDGSRDPKDHARELKHQLRELEDKYKQAMVTNAQLGNVKTSNVFQLELLKDQQEEQEEAMIEVQREYKDKCRDFELLKRDFESMKLENDGLKQLLDLKDKLLQESGLVIVQSDEGEFSLTKCTNMSDVSVTPSGTSLISEESADFLKKAGEGTLGKHVNADIATVDNNEKVIVVETNKVVSSDDGTSVGVEGYDELDKVVETDDSEAENEETDAKTDQTKNDNVSVPKTEGNEVVDYSHDSEVGLLNDSKDSEAVVKTVSPNVEIRVIVDSSSESGDEEEVFFESKSEISPVDSKSGAAVLGESETVPVIDKMDVVEVLHARSSVVSRSSCISMESDVTYHRESEDDLDHSDTECPEEIGKTNIDSESDHVGQDIEVGIISECGVVEQELKDERNELEDKSVVDQVELGDRSVVSSIVDDDMNQGVYHSSDSSIKGESNFSMDLDSHVDKVASTLSEKEKISTDIKAASVESHTVLDVRDEFDEVFNSVPEDFPGLNPENLDQEFKTFAKGYVNDIIGKSVNKVTDEMSEETVRLRQKSKSAEDIDIHVPKRLYSTELVDEVSPYLKQSVSRGSVNILSPLTQVDSENSDEKLKFISFKVDTDADVIFTSVEEEKNPLDGQSVSGYGVYFVGDITEVDKDSADILSSLSDQNLGEHITADPDSGQIPEFISIEMDMDGDTCNVAEEGNKDEVTNDSDSDIDKNESATEKACVDGEAITKENQENDENLVTACTADELIEIVSQEKNDGTRDKTVSESVNTETLCTDNESVNTDNNMTIDSEHTAIPAIEITRASLNEDESLEDLTGSENPSSNLTTESNSNVQVSVESEKKEEPESIDTVSAENEVSSKSDVKEEMLDQEGKTAESAEEIKHVTKDVDKNSEMLDIKIKESGEPVDKEELSEQDENRNNEENSSNESYNVNVETVNKEEVADLNENRGHETGAADDNVNVECADKEKMSEQGGNRNHEPVTADDNLNVESIGKEEVADNEQDGNKVEGTEDTGLNMTESMKEGKSKDIDESVDVKGTKDEFKSIKNNEDGGENDTSSKETVKTENAGDTEGASGGQECFESPGDLSPKSKHASDKDLGRKSSKKKKSRKHSKDEKPVKKDSKDEKGQKKDSKEECSVS